MGRFYDVGHGVWVGDYHACDERGRGFPLVVHAQSELNRAEGRLCRDRDSRGLALTWTEGQGLDQIGFVEIPIKSDCLFIIVDGFSSSHSCHRLCNPDLLGSGGRSGAAIAR